MVSSGQFWSSYIGCDASHKDAVQLFMEQVDVTKRLVSDNPDDMVFVTSAQGTKRISTFYTFKRFYIISFRY